MVFLIIYILFSRIFKIYIPISSIFEINFKKLTFFLKNYEWGKISLKIN